jgi:anti-sigma regulatory factor (Ser/Thr protein kinase)
MEELETRLPASIIAAAEARGFLRAALETWALDGLGEVTELLATELVTNAVVHVGTPLTLRVQSRDGLIRVEVDDDASAGPVVRHVDTRIEHGRGAYIVDQLATRWGTEPREGGKTVWFEIDVVTATEEVHGTD